MGDRLTASLHKNTAILSHVHKILVKGPFLVRAAGISLSRDRAVYAGSSLCCSPQALRSMERVRCHEYSFPYFFFVFFGQPSFLLYGRRQIDCIRERVLLPLLPSLQKWAQSININFPQTSFMIRRLLHTNC